MGRVAGDKARFNKLRRKKIARRAGARALAAELRAQAATGAPKRDSEPPRAPRPSPAT